MRTQQLTLKRGFQREAGVQVLNFLGRTNARVCGQEAAIG